MIGRSLEKLECGFPGIVHLIPSMTRLGRIGHDPDVVPQPLTASRS